MPAELPRVVNYEHMIKPKSMFDVVDPKVKPAALVMLRTAESARLFDKLPQRDAEMLVEYVTAPITAEKVGAYYGLSIRPSQRIIRDAFETLSGYLRHMPELRTDSWGRVGQIKGRPQEEEQPYRHIPAEEVSAALQGFGYGPNKRYVDELYVRADGLQGVGSLKVTKQHCEGHFEETPVFRGADQIEAAAQTMLLLKYVSGGIPAGYGPFFGGIGDVIFGDPVQPGAVLDIMVEAMTSEKRVFSANAWIFSGGVKVAEMAGITGAAMPLPLRDKYLVRSAREQSKVPPAFPPKAKRRPGNDLTPRSYS